MLACEGRLPRGPKRKFVVAVVFFLSAEQCQWVFASNIAVFGLFVVVVVVLSIVKKRILSVFFFEGKCYKIMSFFSLSSFNVLFRLFAFH